MATQQQFKYPATDTQINQWKKRHGHVFLVTVSALDDDLKNIDVHGYFKKPSLDTIAAMGKFQAEDPIKAASILFNDCKISIDPLMEEDDEVKLAAMNHVAGLFTYYQAQVKKL